MAAALFTSYEWDLPVLQSRTEWKLFSHHYIPAPFFPAGAPSSSSTLVGLLDFYITRKQRNIVVHGLDIDEQEYYDGPIHSPHRVPLPFLGPLLHCGLPDIQQNYILSRLTALGVDPVSSRDILTSFFKLAHDADKAGVCELYAAVHVEITNINMINIPLTEDGDDNQLEIWDSEEDEYLLQQGPSPASEKSKMKLNEASFVADDEASDALGMCSVCQEDLSTVEGNTDQRLTKLPCALMFHNSCIVPCLERIGTCPLCRRELVEY